VPRCALHRTAPPSPPPRIACLPLRIHPSGGETRCRIPLPYFEYLKAPLYLLGGPRFGNQIAVTVTRQVLLFFHPLSLPPSPRDNLLALACGSANDRRFSLSSRAMDRDFHVKMRFSAIRRITSRKLGKSSDR